MLQIASFFDIRRHSQHQPQRIIVEAGANIVVAAFGQRLILMIRAACFKLRGSQIQNPFARPLRDEMHKTKQVLGRITESHAAPNSAFKVRSRTAHVEGNHGLVRIPNIDHAVGVLIRRDHLIFIQQSQPMNAQCLKSLFNHIRIQITGDDWQNSALVDGL